MKKSFLILLFFSINFVFTQGLKFATDEQIKTFDIFDSDVLGFSDVTLPSSFSLEKYVPFVLNQGADWNLCWVFYALLWTKHFLQC